MGMGRWIQALAAMLHQGCSVRTKGLVVGIGMA